MPFGFLFQPFFRAELFPARNGLQNAFFPLRIGKIIDVRARKLITLETAFDVFFFGACSYRADFTEEKNVVWVLGQTSQAFGFRKRRHIQLREFLSNLFVFFGGCDVNTAITTVEATRGC
jgi:hypothetical protein